MPPIVQIEDNAGLLNDNQMYNFYVEKSPYSNQSQEGINYNFFLFPLFFIVSRLNLKTQVFE